MMAETSTDKTLFYPISKRGVVAQYRIANKATNAHERALWGSEESMMGRFHLALDLLGENLSGRWLDIGCGEADFFKLAEVRDYRFEQLVGIDITPEMIDHARRKSFHSPAEFHVADLEHLPEKMQGFDLVTLIGVLQQCAVAPEIALQSLAKTLAPDGRLLLTTKNIEWDSFTSGKLRPEKTHSWFTVKTIHEALATAGLHPQLTVGVLPTERQIVNVDQSHTMLVIARRVHEH